MAESLPPLSEVTPEYEPATPPPAKRGLPRWLVAAVVLLGAFTGWLAWQTSQLQSQNAALQSEITTLQGQVEAYRGHLDGARERSTDLRTRMDELDAFLAQDPTN